MSGANDRRARRLKSRAMLVEASRAWPKLLPRTSEQAGCSAWTLSRVLSRTCVAVGPVKIIHLGVALPRRSSALTRVPCDPFECTFGRTDLSGTPIQACSGKGLPRRRSPGCHAWALTPRFHPYRANAKRSPHRPSLRSNDALRRCYFCCAFPRVTPGRCYRLPCPMEPGLSSRVRCVYAGDLPSTFGQPRDPSRSPMRFMGSDKMPRGARSLMVRGGFALISKDSVRGRPDCLRLICPLKYLFDT